MKVMTQLSFSFVIGCFGLLAGCSSDTTGDDPELNPVQAADVPVATLADARPCNENEQPKQIRFVLAPGAVICYGGLVGALRIDDIYVTGVQAGGYSGYVTCDNNHQIKFSPHEVYYPKCNVRWLGITPPW
ncbi:hypothetical protein LZC95_48570 [Pendulispora brunnea]|uniref:Lipoprotein n=1 Tax=Pendulispora brunnea TaxID=2905690 RepID=A0ABZ2K6H6_9BACT